MSIGNNEYYKFYHWGVPELTPNPLIHVLTPCFPLSTS